MGIYMRLGLRIKMIRSTRSNSSFISLSSGPYVCVKLLSSLDQLVVVLLIKPVVVVVSEEEL